MSFDAKTDCGTLPNFDHLEIVSAPHPALDTASEFVVEIDASVRLLAARMMALMYAGVPDGQGGVTRGIGLAANQVNVLRRVIVVDIPGKKSVRGLVPAVVTRGPLVMVNPVVTMRMSALEWRSEVERCLSYPGVEVAIERPLTVDVEYVGLDGCVHSLACTGLLARCVQHLVDILGGQSIETVGRMQAEARAKTRAAVEGAVA